MTNTGNSTVITLDDVAHVARLANLTINPTKLQTFQKQLKSILEYVRLVQDAHTQDVLETSQTTGLINVLREDRVDTSRSFTQADALANSQQTHNGYFLVPSVFEENE